MTFVEGSISTSQEPHGATISSEYVGRKVRVYAVLDTELREVAFFNTLANIFLSVGSGLFSIAVGIWIGATFADRPTPEGTVLAHFMAPVLCVLAVACGGIALWALNARKSAISVIREQSEPQRT
jgi:hypothetical protein